MRVTGIYVYPVKGLRGIPLPAAELGPQGVRYDRRFMLLTTERNKVGTLKKMQLSAFPECALFSQEIEGEDVVVRYHPPDAAAAAAKSGKWSMSPDPCPPLSISLEPSLDQLRPIDVDLHGSPARGYRMGAPYEDWFSACFGFDVVLVFIGDGRRRVLGSTLKPKLTRTTTTRQSTAAAPHHATTTLYSLPRLLLSGDWLAALAAYLIAGWLAILAAVGLGDGHLSMKAKKSLAAAAEPDEPWIAFSDVAPFLVTSEASWRNVNARLSAGLEVPMYKFRPNLVVDGEGEDAWAEDYWAELTVRRKQLLPSSQDGEGEEAATEEKKNKSEEEGKGSFRLLLTSNCGRCSSLNVDYATGARAAGELGTVLGRLTKDRRVDPGTKYSPVFGRYAFLDQVDGDGDGDGEAVAMQRIAVGDEVAVTRRNAERTVWDWPDL